MTFFLKIDRSVSSRFSVTDCSIALHDQNKVVLYWGKPKNRAVLYWWKLQNRIVLYWGEPARASSLSSEEQVLDCMQNCTSQGKIQAGLVGKISFLSRFRVVVLSQLTHRTNFRSNEFDKIKVKVNIHLINNNSRLK